MNFIKNIFFALITISILVACNSEDPINNHISNDVHSRADKVNNISVPISIDIGNNETRGFMKYSNGKISFPKKDLTMLVATRVSSEIVTQELIFKYENGRHFYHGQIKVPASGLNPDNELSNVEIVAFPLKAGEDSIMTYAKYNVYSSSDPSRVAIDLHYNNSFLSLPYIGSDTDVNIDLSSYTEWTKLEYDNTRKNKVFKKITLYFKTPFTIIALKIYNKSTKNIYPNHLLIERQEDFPDPFGSRTKKFIDFFLGKFYFKDPKNKKSLSFDDMVLRDPSKPLSFGNLPKYDLKVLKPGEVSETMYIPIYDEDSEIQNYKFALVLSSKEESIFFGYEPIYPVMTIDRIFGSDYKLIYEFEGKKIKRATRINVSLNINDEKLENYNYYDNPFMYGF